MEVTAGGASNFESGSEPRGTGKRGAVGVYGAKGRRRRCKPTCRRLLCSPSPAPQRHETLLWTLCTQLRTITRSSFPRGLYIEALVNFTSKNSDTSQGLPFSATRAATRFESLVRSRRTLAPVTTLSFVKMAEQNPLGGHHVPLLGKPCCPVTPVRSDP